jgi:transposase
MGDANVTDLQREIASLKAELQLQKDLVAELLKRLYGARSEKLDTAQLLLAFLAEAPAKKPDAAVAADAPAAEPAPAKRHKPRHRKLRDSLRNLPTVTTEIVPEEVLAAPADYRRIGEEVSERLEVSPSTFTRHRTVRPTYVLKGDPEAVPATAPLPVPLLEGSVLTPLLGRIC